VRSLGIDVEVDKPSGAVTIHGHGLHGWKAPSTDLDAGNSGSTIRMMAGCWRRNRLPAGLSATSPFHGVPWAGDETPHGDGREVRSKDEQYPPLTIHGGELSPIDYTCRLPVHR